MALTRLLVEHDQFLGDLADRAAHPALRLGEVGATEAVQHGCLAAHVLAQGVDLVARHVQLVAALVGEQQVVALDAADGALDHALVLADPVLVVDDVVAGLEVFEQARALALAWPGLAVGSATAGEIGLGHDGQLRRRHGAAAMQGGDGDMAAGSGQRLFDSGAGAVQVDAELEAVVEQEGGHPLGRGIAVGGHDHPVAVGEQAAQPVGEACAFAHHRAPSGGRDHRRVGGAGHTADRPRGLAGR